MRPYDETSFTSWDNHIEIYFKSPSKYFEGLFHLLPSFTHDDSEALSQLFAFVRLKVLWGGSKGAETFLRRKFFALAETIAAQFHRRL